MEEQRPVLLMSGNHTTQSLWKPLAEHFDICLIHTQMSQMMTDMNILGGYGIQKYMSAEVQETAINIAYALAARLHEPDRADELTRHIAEAFNGSTIPTNLQSPQVNDWWPGMLGERVKNSMTVIGMLEAAVKDRKVSGCIVHEDVTPDARAIVMFCKAQGIPTIHIPHANDWYVGEKWDIHTECISDYILAAGVYMKDWYTRWGYNPERIRVVGMPQWDSFYGDLGRPGKSESRKALGIKTDEETVLVYASSWAQLTSARGEFNKEFENSLRMMIETAQELPATLIVKMHPGEPANQEQIYLKAIKDNNLEGCVTRMFNQYTLAATDVLVSHGPSNICCHAAAWNVPSCYIPTEDYAFPLPGPVMAGGNATYAARLAMQLDTEKTWGPFAKLSNDAHPEGNACERIVREVVDICQL